MINKLAENLSQAHERYNITTPEICAIMAAAKGMVADITCTNCGSNNCSTDSSFAVHFFFSLISRKHLLKYWLFL